MPSDTIAKELSASESDWLADMRIKALRGENKQAMDVVIKRLQEQRMKNATDAILKRDIGIMS